MWKKAKRYTPKFRRQMMQLHRRGEGCDELAREFDCTSRSIRQWVKGADRDEGRGDGELTTMCRGEVKSASAW